MIGDHTALCNLFHNGKCVIWKLLTGFPVAFHVTVSNSNGQENVLLIGENEVLGWVFLNRFSKSNPVHF